MSDEKGYEQTGELKEKEIPIHLYYILGLIGITITFIIFRIILYFYSIDPYIDRNKDVDFIILIEGMKNGLINFYDPIERAEWPPYYLYFWYFLFFPIFLMPSEIGIYIWDAEEVHILNNTLYNNGGAFDISVYAGQSNDNTYVYNNIAKSFDTLDIGHQNVLPCPLVD